MSSQIQTVLLASAFVQKSLQHTTAEKKKKVDDKNDSASATPAASLPLANRPCGVFPGGIQPEKVVLVVDDTIPHLNLEELRSKGYDIRTGSNLDVHGFLQLITSDDHYRNDGVLYVVQPGLDFFVKNMEVIDLEKVEFKVDNKLLEADEEILGLQSSFLIENVKKSVRFGKIHSHEDIFMFSDDDLTALSTFNLSLPNIKQKSSATMLASSSQTYFKTSDLTRKKRDSPSTDGSAIEKVTSNEEHGSSSPSKYEEQDSKSLAAACKVHVAGPLQTNGLLQTNGPLQTIVTCILQQALALRNSVLINTLNSEVVFLGYPVECLHADNAQEDYPGVSINDV